MTMTSDTIHRMGNAIALFSDPFGRAVREVLAEPIWPRRRSRGDALLAKDEPEIDFDLGGRAALRDYEAALARGADPEDSFRKCAERIAAVVGTNMGNDFGFDRDITFGKIQSVINRTQAHAYVDRFWDFLGGRTAEIDEGRLEAWFLAPDSPRLRFKDCHCPMDDETTELAVREYRRVGTNRVIANGRWEEVAWHRLVFKETGDPYSVAWYDKFQTMAAELTSRLDLYPIEFLFCSLPGAGFSFGAE